MAVLYYVWIPACAAGLSLATALLIYGLAKVRASHLRLARVSKGRERCQSAIATRPAAV